MSFNGSGVFTPNSSGQPVVSNTLITAAVFNAFTADVATALSTCVLKDGQQTVTANIPMAGFKITGLGVGSARTDAANIGLLQDGTGVYVATVGGTADVITLTPSPAITAYVAGQSFKFIASGANTTNVTVNVSGLGAKAITKNGATALAAGDIPSGMIVWATYDGTRFVLVGSIGTAGIPLSTLTTAGDIVYATGASTPARLGIGTALQVLRTNAGATAPEWAAAATLTLGTPVASTSGTSIDFTGIPATAKRITINFNGVSTNGTSAPILQLGDSGGIETSGYLGAAWDNGASFNYTTGIGLIGATAASVRHGSITLTLLNASTNTWSAAGSFGRSDAAAAGCVGATKSLSATLDRVRVTTAGGADTFDAGEINITYE